MRLKSTLWTIALLTTLVAASAVALLTHQKIRRAEAAAIRPIPSPLAADKGFGTTVDLTRYSPTDLYAQLDAMQAAGLTWLRQPLNWADIETEPGVYDWQKYDEAIGAAHLRGFKIIAVLQTSPAWARPPNTGPAAPPIEATDFGRFARAAALHYQAEIYHFQIWHEPNLSQNWGNAAVNAKAYTLMLKNAAIAIKTIQPQATVIAASLAPTTQTGPLNLAEADYLQAMYRAGAAPWFDVLGAQLYGFHLPITPVLADEGTLNIHRVTLLRQVMAANGDAATPVWATAFGWNALPANWDGAPPPWPVDVPEKQIARTAEAIAYARDTWPWLGPILAPRWDAAGLSTDDPAQGFALNPTFLPVFEQAAHSLPFTATVGAYPATHISGRYSPGWLFSSTTADVPYPAAVDEPPSLTVPFRGTEFALHINRGDFQGYLWVTIDGQPANALPRDESGRSYVVLNDPLRQPDTVTVARNLPPGNHVAVIRPEGGWGQWAIAGWQVSIAADTGPLRQNRAVAALVALLAAGWLIARAWPHRHPAEARLLAGWAALRGAFGRLGFGWQVGLAFGLAFAFVLLPDGLSVAALPLLGLVFLLKLDAGLMVLAFGVSFFLAKKSVVVTTVSVLELGLGLMLVAMALRLVLAARESPEKRPPWPVVRLGGGDWAALALVAISAVATAAASQRGVSLYEFRTVIFGSVAFYFLIRWAIRLEGLPIDTTAWRLLDAFVAGAVLHAALALFQYIFLPEQTITAEGVRRAIGFLYGSPNNLALFLERAFPILTVGALFGWSTRRRALYGLGWLVLSAALVLTYSKGTLLLAIPAALIFVALLKGGKNAWLGMGTALILLAVALIPIARTPRFQNTFSLQPGSTAFSRLKLWQSAWQMLKEHPLTGLGLDNFLYQYRTRYILPSAWAEPDLSHPHNIMLDFGTRLGLGGVAVLLWLQGRFWLMAIRSYWAQPGRRVLLLALMGSMIPFLIHGLVDNAFFLVDLAYAFFLIFALAEAVGEAEPETAQNE